VFNVNSQLPISNFHIISARSFLEVGSWRLGVDT
jgi:hypothetical protein